MYTNVMRLAHDGTHSDVYVNAFADKAGHTVSLQPKTHAWITFGEWRGEEFNPCFASALVERSLLSSRKG